MKINELFNTMEIWMTNEESKLLEKLQTPVKLHILSEHEKYIVQTMIRKNLVSKIGFENPSVVANENKNSN